MLFRVAIVACGLILCLPLLSRSGPSYAADMRLVTIGGDVTEIVHALGRGGEVVAVDTTSLYPREVLRLPKVGYMRALSSEGILSLRPDLILANAKAGPPTSIMQITASGVPFMVSSEEIGFDALVQRVTKIGAALNRSEAADALIARMKRQFAELARIIEWTTARPKVLFLLTTGERGAPLASGTGTIADAMITLAGAINPIKAYAEYRPLSPESAVAAAPDYILVASHTLEMAGGRENVLRLPQIALTPAAQKGRLVEIGGDLLSGFGPRTAKAAAELFLAFHPDVAVAADILAKIDGQ